jgi:hypothetical protein
MPDNEVTHLQDKTKFPLLQIIFRHAQDKNHTWVLLFYMGLKLKNKFQFETYSVSNGNWTLDQKPLDQIDTSKRLFEKI